MKVLVVAGLYPNAASPTRGLFVRERVVHVARRGIDARVVAPIPRRPLSRPAAAVPEVEQRDGLTIAHPPFLVLPGIGAPIHGFTYRAALGRGARLAAPDGPPDVVDAHYLYPDGFAAVLHARRTGLPIVVSARGTDANVIAHDPLLGLFVRFTIRHANRLVAVSEDLRRKLLALGADPARVRSIPNGIDPDRFLPGDRSVARRRLDVGDDATLILSVGNLVRNKGHHHLVRAFASCAPRSRAARLWIVGDGPERAGLARLIGSLGLEDRVRILGSRPPAELPELYAAADLFCLATEREGWPNAVVEALACGLPVVATRTGGIPELVTDGENGILVDRPDRDLADAMGRAMERPWDRAAISARARRRTWGDVAREVEAVLEEARAEGPRRRFEREGVR